MKKLIAILLCLCMCFACVACGNDTNNETQPTVSTGEPTETPTTPEGSAPTEDATEPTAPEVEGVVWDTNRVFREYVAAGGKMITVEMPRPEGFGSIPKGAGTIGFWSDADNNGLKYTAAGDEVGEGQMYADCFAMIETIDDLYNSFYKDSVYDIQSDETVTLNGREFRYITGVHTYSANQAEHKHYVEMYITTLSNGAEFAFIISDTSATQCMAETARYVAKTMAEGLVEIQ